MSEEVKEAPAQAPSAVDTSEPNWLPARLEREREKVRKQVLSELGVEKPEDAKQAIEELKAKRDAEKSELQKLLEQKAALEVQAKRAAELEAAVRIHADKALTSLTEAQRNAVKTLAGDDPARVAAAIETLRPTWAVAVAPPATTAPAATAPPPAATSQPTAKDIYESLRTSNPFAAAEYLEQHQAEIYK